jgi:hypothetical protein
VKLSPSSNGPAHELGNRPVRVSTASVRTPRRPGSSPD